MPSELIKHVGDNDFESVVLRSSIPVLVDFWAPWCGPCKALAPVVEKVAAEQSGRVLVCKVNVDESPNISAQYGIRGIPTLIYFKGGQVANQITGSVPKAQIDAMFG